MPEQRYRSALGRQNEVRGCPGWDLGLVIRGEDWWEVPLSNAVTGQSARFKMRPSLSWAEVHERAKRVIQAISEMPA